LHRLQKTVIILIIFLLLIYIITHIEFHRTQKNKISNKHEPHDNILNKNVDANLDKQLNENQELKQNPNAFRNVI
jgi:hypothetical protein